MGYTKKMRMRNRKMRNRNSKKFVLKGGMMGAVGGGGGGVAGAPVAPVAAGAPGAGGAGAVPQCPINHPDENWSPAFAAGWNALNDWNPVGAAAGGAAAAGAAAGAPGAAAGAAGAPGAPLEAYDAAVAGAGDINPDTIAFEKNYLFVQSYKKILKAASPPALDRALVNIAATVIP